MVQRIQHCLKVKVLFSGEHDVGHGKLCQVWFVIHKPNCDSWIFSVDSSNVLVMNVSCPVFKQGVQNVHQLQQHTIKVCCELMRLSYE